MREPTINDIDMMARALAGLPDEDREHAAGRIIERAQFADLYRKNTGRTHAAFGSGDIASAVTCGDGLPPTYRASDPRFLRATALVCGLLADRIEAHLEKVAA